MKRTVRFALLVLPLLASSFGLGKSWAGKELEQDRATARVAIAGIDYEAVGTLAPAPGQNFPKNWGRVVGQTLGNDKGFFLFEAEDGTLRQVMVTFSQEVWKEPARIVRIHVLAIGRK